MNIFFGFLTVVMFFDCLVLMFLVLLQLPKKEAGAGMAFGGSATDALFGAGSGNALTALTQYAAGIFFGLAIIMAIIMAHNDKSTSASDLMEKLSKGSAMPAHVANPPASNAPSGSITTNNYLQSVPPPAVTATNSPLPVPAPAAPPSLQIGTNK